MAHALVCMVTLVVIAMDEVIFCAWKKHYRAEFVCYMDLHL